MQENESSQKKEASSNNISDDTYTPGRITWRAREYEHRPKNKRRVLIIGLFLSAIVIYAIATQSPIMAITFILIGIVGYLGLTREAPVLDIFIDIEGIHIGNEVYPYENIRSFWVFYEPGERKCISIHTNGDLTPYVHIPLGTTDPLQVRAVLLQFLPERRHPLRLVDMLEKYL